MALSIFFFLVFILIVHLVASSFPLKCYKKYAKVAANSTEFLIHTEWYLVHTIDTFYSLFGAKVDKIVKEHYAFLLLRPQPQALW